MTVSVDGIVEVNTMLADLSLMPKNAVGFKRLAVKAKQIILERTGRGVDVRGGNFTPYSDAYLDYKESRKGEAMSNVDLFDSGDMLGSMAVDGGKSGARVFFADSLQAKKAEAHNDGLGNLPKRAFFAINNPESEELIALAADDIDKYLANL